MLLDDLTVVELIARFWTHAESFYRKQDGTPTGELINFKSALKPLKYLYAESPAIECGPLALKAVRERMIALGWCRRNVNRQVGRIKHVFKWAVGEELIPGSVSPAAAGVGAIVAGLGSLPWRNSRHWKYKTEREGRPLASDAFDDTGPCHLLDCVKGFVASRETYQRPRVEIIDNRDDWEIQREQRRSNARTGHVRSA